MSTKVETVRQDWDWQGDGIWDELTTIRYDFVGDKLVTKTSVNEDLHGGMARTEVTNYTYDAAGNNIFEERFADNGGTELQHALTINRTFDASGRIVSEEQLSPDFDGNGVLDDYKTVKSFYYDDAGRLVGLEEDYYTYGFQAQSDYRNEDWEYDAQGRLVKHTVDDPTMFNNVIVRNYNYKHGDLRTIKEQNENRFGDERARTDESFTWNKDGTLKTKTDWADWSDRGWMQRVDTEFTWRDGYDSQLIKYDFEGDFDPEAIKFVENWYNSDGNLTHTLISHDPEGDGGPLAGGYDSRDLFVKGWNGDEMVSETRDFGADGVIEYQFTSEWMNA